MSDLVGMELRYTLEGRPVPWQRARSNGRQRWTDPRMQRAQRAHALLATSLVARMIAWPRDARYELEVIAFCAPVQRGDSDNYAKLVADALQGAAYENDRQLVEVARGQAQASQHRSGLVTGRKAPQLRLGAWVERELVVDLFAGGGGASEGITRALGRHPDIAINHDPAAVAMHEANHPTTTHYCESVFRVSPREAVGGRPVGLLWLSPDCTHHSRAKGGKPRKKKIRGLAWVAVRWAHEVRPRVICLENVEEFAEWGPLTEDGLPCPVRKGQTFRAFVRKLERYGYRVEHRMLVAADYGAPTTRKRLFLVARCDGRPIVWPEPTHGKSCSRPWRAAAEIIDWTLPCPSIFERARPLADATLRRIATGVRRYVIEAARPFIVPVTHPRDARVHSIDEPVRTVTAANRGELALVAPTLVQTGYGEREGQAPRALDLHRPLGTVVAGGAKHAVVAAFLTKHYGNGVIGHGLERPIGAVTTVDHHSLTVAHLEKFYGTASGADVRDPLPTVTAGGQHLAEVRTLLARYAPGVRDDVEVHGERYAIVDIGMRMLSPRELFRAQGFGDHYVIDPVFDKKPLSKTEQIAKAGNSVPPVLAEAIVRANVRLREEAAA